MKPSYCQQTEKLVWGPWEGQELRGGQGQKSDEARALRTRTGAAGGCAGRRDHHMKGHLSGADVI